MFSKLVNTINQNAINLSAEEEEALVQRFLTGDAEAKNILINAHLRLVVIISLEYVKKGGALEDLFQEGVVGLHIALDKFEPEKGFRFSTYASWWVRNQLQDFIRTNTRQVVLPSHIIDELSKLMAITQKYVMEERREPTDEELAKELNVTVEKVFLLKAQLNPSVSLNENHSAKSDNPFETDLSAVIEDVHAECAAEYSARLSDIERVKNVMGSSRLSDQERGVLHYRFGLNGNTQMTLEATGKIIGVSIARVQQIEKTAIEKLQRVMLSS